MDQLCRRKGAVLINALAIAVCLLAVSGAGAKVIPTMSTTLTLDQVVPTGTSGATTIIQVPATALGQHSDLTVDMNFRYGATGLVSGGWDDPKTYPAPSDPSESLKSLVVDIPPGLVGNPNAVPPADRCDMSLFETGLCPASATVGEFYIHTGLMPTGATGPANASYFPIATLGPTEIAGGFTRVSLLRTEPEVPALLGVYVSPPLGVGRPILTLMRIAPESSDLHLRTTTPRGIDHKLIAPDDSTSYPPGSWNANFRIDAMKLKLYGRLPNGNAFMTNPTSCQEWTSRIWASAHFFNDNADADPLGTGSNTFRTGNRSTIIPNCTNQSAVPFPITGSVAIDTPKRDYSPAFDFTIDNPGVQGNVSPSTSPRNIVTTIPASINVDVQQLGRTCTLPAFNADSCPASARVGSVAIETPLIKAGLSGDVYLVKRNATSGLPDLGLRVRGAITFTQLGSNRYIGAKNNQIETTFLDIPQVGFSKLTFHLDGGPQGLLRSLSCPTYNKAPAVPTFTYNFTAWSGAQATSTTPLNMANCFGIQTLKKYKKCLHSMLPIHPNYQSRSRVKNVVLTIDGRRKASRKHSPFRFDLPIKKLKLKKRKGNKHTLVLKATYDDKTVSKKKATFKVCKRR